VTKPKSKLTREALHEAILPPNTCKVKAFRDALPVKDREVLDEALGYPKADFPASALRDWLIRIGYPETEVPGSDPINDHRAGRRPCRCHG
jgi:hypothetical protein